MSDRRTQDGSATILVLAVAATVVSAAAVGSGLGGAMLLRHRVAAAADAAALGAAMRAVTGDPSACARAKQLARVNGATLVACTVHGSVVDVSVAASGGGWLAWLPVVRLNARAGPADTYGAETYREKPAPLDAPS